MVVFDSASIYIESCTDLRAKITAVNNIIIAMQGKLATAATSDNKKEYEFNDGQTKVRLVYTGVKAMTDGILALEKLKQTYINQLTGRKFTLVDGKNFR